MKCRTGVKGSESSFSSTPPRPRSKAFRPTAGNALDRGMGGAPPHSIQCQHTLCYGGHARDGTGCPMIVPFQLLCIFLLYLAGDR